MYIYIHTPTHKIIGTRMKTRTISISMITCELEKNAVLIIRIIHDTKYRIFQFQLGARFFSLGPFANNCLYIHV